jgi:hypothetical protein
MVFVRLRSYCGISLQYFELYLEFFIFFNCNVVVRLKRENGTRFEGIELSLRRSRIFLKVISKACVNRS